MSDQEEKHSGTNKVRGQIDDALDELQGIADSIRLKMHLGSKEAKDHWEELEPKLHELQHETERVVERTSSEAKDLAADLKERFLKLKKDIGA
ncbi:MAG: hypothetical protein DRJ42_23905 [Deltaproteobacteria bacterium]|nr:MAG: hypothetical protein DRJ42_23905 [Deltaproteobacteria bacterium]